MPYRKTFTTVFFYLFITYLFNASVLGEEPTAPRITRMQSVSNGVELTVMPGEPHGATEWISISQNAMLTTNRWELLTVTPWTMSGDAMSWTDFLSTNAGPTRFYRLTINGDVDRDGLPDWWELHHFSDPTNMVADADPDHDTWSNLQEYRRGGDPTNTWRTDTNNLLKLQVFTPLR